MEWESSNAIALIAVVISIVSAFFSYHQLDTSNMNIVYQRMDSYFDAYSKVSSKEIDVFATDYYTSNPDKKTDLALTAERLLLVLDAVNRAGRKDLSATWYRFLVTMSGPLCDPNVRLEGFAIERLTQEQLLEARRIACRRG